MGAMMVSIDRVGRVVIPKEVRDALSLGVDAQLDLTVEGDELRLVPVRQVGRRIVEVDGWPVIEASPGHSISDADVRRWRDDGQR